MKETDWAKLFGIRIKSRRRALRITQKELADAVHCGESSIQQYERGLRIPKEKTKEAIAAALGCSVSDLFGYKTESGYKIKIGAGEGLPPDELRARFDKIREEAAEKKRQQTQSAENKPNETSPQPAVDTSDLTDREIHELQIYRDFLIFRRGQSAESSPDNNPDT